MIPYKKYKLLIFETHIYHDFLIILINITIYS